MFVRTFETSQAMAREAAALEGPITPDVPGSALRQYPKVTMYLDAASAALLDPETPRALAISG